VAAIDDPLLTPIRRSRRQLSNALVAQASRRPEQSVSKWIEHRTGRSIKKLVPTAHRHRPPPATVQIKAGRQIVTAADPLPDNLRDALTKVLTYSAH